MVLSSSDDDAPRSRARAEPLREIEEFGPNPGQLRMFVAAPNERPRRCPTVLVLHGCTQSAAGFDAYSEWSQLGAEHGFVVIYAEQTTRNHDQGCFSWYQAGDVTRGQGEVASLRQMIDWAAVELAIDTRNVFVCGLSAGGAMAGAMLATYPEVFAAGAIVAGLPYGAATDLSEALDAMYVGRSKDASRWGSLVRAASDHAGPWPRISIWYGTADKVVAPINAGELVKQWTNVHGVNAAAPTVDRVGSATRRIWRDVDGGECVSDYMVPGLGHGIPIADADPPAPFFLPAGISAVQQIALDFGLLTRRGPNRLAALLRLEV